jgi:6-phosphogluconolactonase (cycloisomerase 2 family)
MCRLQIDKGDEMKKALLLAALVTTVVAIAVPAASAASRATAGAVYTITNAATGNGVAYFSRDAAGALSLVATYATGGNGTGANLGSQGAVGLSDDGKLLFAVNAGSDSISEFAVREDGSLNLLSTFSSNGALPTSLTIHKNLLYVLDAGAGSITGYKIDGQGRVELLATSTQPLLGSTPAQVAFSPNGSELVVTEKGTSTLDTFVVGPHGLAQQGVSSPSAGGTPFGFQFDNLGRAFVSEAAGSASSYAIDASGAHTISGAVVTHQAAPCWLVVTADGRFAYTANAGAGTISGYSIAPDGSIALLDASGATGSFGAGSHPLDEALSGDGQYLYVLVDGHHTIGGFRINADGSLTALGEVGSLPAGAVGLAAS